MRVLQDLLREAYEAGASDIHITEGRPIFFRIDGALQPVGEEVLDTESSYDLIRALFESNERATKQLQEEKQCDFSYEFDKDLRFRVNVFYRMNKLAAALRLIPARIYSIEELHLPPQIARFAEKKQGLVLIVGPAGHGKSTTLAALIDYINQQRTEHIITIEDPIEYMFENKRSIIDQREVGHDAKSFVSAIRVTLRQDPNVVMIGEIRDLESMRTALTIAETGHLVFATLHTNDAANTVERVIDSFPAEQQYQVRSQLANTLSGIISQRLLPWTAGGRIPAVEILVATTATRNVIREGNIHQLPGIIQTGSDLGMQTLDASLQALVDAGAVQLEVARPYFSSYHE